MSLKWQVHVAQVLHTKMKEWPPSMNIRRVAFLQDSNVAMRVAILDQLIDDCKNNLVEHTKTIIQPRPYITPVSTFAPPGWLERDFPDRYNDRKAGPTVEYSISAKVFSSWLMAKEEKPSEVIKAWFDVYGVAEQVAPKPETATPEAAPLHAASATIANTVPVATDATDGEESQLRGWMKHGFKFAEGISKEKPFYKASQLFDAIRARSKENTESPFSIDEKDKNLLIVNATRRSLRRSTFIGDWDEKKRKR